MLARDYSVIITLELLILFLKKEHKMNKAVVLGTNYYIGLSIIRCLGVENVHVVACDYDFDNAYGAKSKYISEFLEIEGLNKIDRNAADKLIEYGKKQDKKPVLFPSHDKYVEFIDKYHDEFAEYFLLTQSKEINSILMDKWKLNELCEEHGVKVPKSVDIQDENLFAIIEEKVKYPCLLKPKDTVVFTKAFRAKSFICNNREEVEHYCKECISKSIEAVIQEIIPGFDDHMVTYDSYIDQNGQTTHYMTAQKLRQWPINFGASVFTKQKYIPELVDIAKPFLEKINYRGFSEIEFKIHNQTDDIYVIEVNVRTTNFNNLIYKVGINMPYIAYAEKSGLKMPKSVYLKEDTRYAFIYGLEDFLAMIKYKRTGQQAISKTIADSITKKWAPAIFSISDIKPWIEFNKTILKKLGRKIVGK